MTKINLGDKVKCTITGFVGIAVARTEWITGCSRITIQPECKRGKTSELEEAITLDEPTLKVLKRLNVKKEKEDIGGPMPSPMMKESPKKY